MANLTRYDIDPYWVEGYDPKIIAVEKGGYVKFDDVKEFLKTPTNSAMDAICAYTGKCQYQNNGTACTCKLPASVSGCPHRQHQ